MSLLAGFDFILELAPNTLAKLIKANLKIGGLPANPPFEFTLPFSASGAKGSAHVIVDDLNLKLTGDNGLGINMHFSGTSVAITSPFQVSIASLEGTFVISTSVQLVNSGNPNQKVIALNLNTASAMVVFTAASQNKIVQGLSGTPLNLGLFQTAADQAVQKLVQGLGQQKLPFGFNVVSGNDGSLSPWQFEKLEVHNIGNQALGLFGILLLANDSKGNASLKTTTAITGGHDLCLSLSPDAFHALVFCPGLAQALKTTVNKMPPSCGPAGSFDVSGVKLTSLSDSFAAGKIDLNAKMEKSGPCYEAKGSLHGTVTLSVNGTTLTPKLALDAPQIKVDIAWYCWLVVGLIAGPIGLIVVGILNGIISQVVNSLGNSLGNFVPQLPKIGLGGLQSVSFDMVDITTEGLTLNGKATVFIPSSPSKGLRIKGSVQTLNKETVGTGIYKVPSGCLKGEYPYTEYQQSQLGTFQVIPTLLSQPLAYEWRIEYYKGYWGYNSSPTLISSAKLTGPYGSPALANVDTQYPLPLPGGSQVTQTAHLNYANYNAVPGPYIELRNTAKEGNWSALLIIKATDPDGNVFETSTGAQFDGDVVEIGGDYQAKVAQCAIETLIELSKISYKGSPLEWMPVDFPDPGELSELVRTLVSLNTPQADDLLLNAKVAHGASFNRALFSRDAAEVGKQVIDLLL